MTVIQGMARRSKASAVLLEADGRVVHIAGRMDWPPGVDGLLVRVEGTLTREARLPRARINEQGPIAQGVAPDSSPEWWLDGAVWSLVHKEPATGPWVLRVADGSGNLSVISRKSAGHAATWSYEPITPEVSSSGHYSGGVAAQGELSPQDTALLWATVRALQADTGHHCVNREMGTTEIKEESAESRGTVRLRRGAATALEQLLSQFKEPERAP